MEENQKDKRKSVIMMAIEIVLIAILVLLILSKIVFGIKFLGVMTGSMEPNIHVNDVVIIRKVKQDEINEGDIISFVVDGDTITHRIIEIEKSENGETLYTTKGDANNIEDETKITFENIKGKYVGKIPKIGIILSIFK